MDTGKTFFDKWASAGCAVNGCDHAHHGQQMFIHAACHPMAQIEASYKPGTGYLVLACRQCKKEIVRAKLAN